MGGRRWQHGGVHCHSPVCMCQKSIKKLLNPNIWKEACISQPQHARAAPTCSCVGCCIMTWVSEPMCASWFLMSDHISAAGCDWCAEPVAHHKAVVTQLKRVAAVGVCGRLWWMLSDWLRAWNECSARAVRTKCLTPGRCCRNAPIVWSYTPLSITESRQLLLIHRKLKCT